MIAALGWKMKETTQAEKDAAMARVRRGSPLFNPKK